MGRPFISHEFFWQLIICFLQSLSDLPVGFLCHPHTEIRPPIVVSGYLVVISKAVGASAHKAYCNFPFIFRKFFRDHGFTAGLIILPGNNQTLIRFGGVLLQSPRRYGTVFRLRFPLLLFPGQSLFAGGNTFLQSVKRLISAYPLLHSLHRLPIPLQSAGKFFLLKMIISQCCQSCSKMAVRHLNILKYPK